MVFHGRRDKYTLAPASARPRAISYPMPPAPPVMITVLPVMLNILKTLSSSGGFGARIDCGFAPFPLVAVILATEMGV